MDFKIGDMVRFTNKMEGNLHGPKVNFDMIPRRIIYVNANQYRLNGLPDNWFKAEELELSSFEVGDIVKINKNATINDFTKNHWGGCQINTLKFLETHGNLDENYEVVEVTDTSLRLKYILKETDINKNIFEIVRHTEVHEMTVKEIEEKLGINGLKVIAESKEK